MIITVSEENSILTRLTSYPRRSLFQQTYLPNQRSDVICGRPLRIIDQKTDCALAWVLRVPWHPRIIKRMHFEPMKFQSLSTLAPVSPTDWHP